MDQVYDRAKKDSDYLKINSEVARRKIAGEVLKRYKAVDQGVWQFFQSRVRTNEQSILLFYVCLKTYTLLFDFVQGVVVRRWQQRLLSLDKSDFERFLDTLIPTHPELQKLTEATRRKLAQITMLMLKQAGLLERGQLVTPSLGAEVWQFFIDQDDDWMLDAGMLTRADRERLGLLLHE